MNQNGRSLSPLAAAQSEAESTELIAAPTDYGFSLVKLTPDELSEPRLSEVRVIASASKLSGRCGACCKHSGLV